MDPIKLGDRCILVHNEFRYMLLQVRQGFKVKLGRRYQVPHSLLVGVEPGVDYFYTGKELKPLSAKQRDMLLGTGEEEEGEEEEGEKGTLGEKTKGEKGTEKKKPHTTLPPVAKRQRTNENIEEVSESLTEKDIVSLLVAGKDGEEILNAFCERSSQFAKKSFYSQKKYLRRKAKKFFCAIRVQRVSVLGMMESVMAKNLGRVHGLQVDMLGRMLLHTLSLLGTSANKDVSLFQGENPISTRIVVDQTKSVEAPVVLVVDDIGGMLVCAALEKLGGCGKVLAVYQGNEQEIHSRIGQYEWFDFSSKVADSLECVSMLEMQALLNSNNANPWIGTSLLVATPYPETMVPWITQFLQPGSPIAVYHPTSKALISCKHALSQKCIGLEIEHCFTRTHQVLPGRTRPSMKMIASTGELLTGRVTLYEPTR